MSAPLPGDRMRRPRTVSELTAEIRVLLERRFPRVAVIGEVSNAKLWKGRHLFFTIKDAQAVLEAVIWDAPVQARRLGLALPADQGAYVLEGAVRVHDRSGRYRLDVRRWRPAGVGALAAEFERRRREWAKRGWFDEARKREPPALPQRIVVVTSPQAAAWQDVQRVLKTKPGWLRVWLSPCQVQGDAAPAEIARAIARARLVNPDVILLVRGGGSLEDLWSFNEEAVVRAILDAPAPVITGIGHESDTTLADLAADVRASTPTRAAELCCPSRAELLQRLPSRSRLRALAERHRRHAAERLRHARRAQAHALGARLARARSDAVALAMRLERAAAAVARARAGRLRGLERLLARHAPHAELARRRARVGALAARLARLPGRFAARRAQIEGLAGRLGRAAPELVRRRREALAERSRRLRRAAPFALAARRRALAGVRERLRAQHARRRIEQAGARLAEARRRLAQAARLGHARRRARLDALHAGLRALGPEAVLARGYALVRRPDGTLVTRAGMLHPPEAIRVRFADGEVEAEARRRT